MNLDVAGSDPYFLHAASLTPPSNSLVTTAMYVTTSSTYELVGRSTTVPEPSTLAMLGSSLIGLGFTRRKRLQQTRSA